jgi:branched-chain amino acid transport system permease protein
MMLDRPQHLSLVADPARAPANPVWRATSETRLSRIARIVGLAAVAGLILLPAIAPRTLLQDLFFVFTILTLAQLWNVLAGWGGLVSVGQQAFVGLGAYVLFAAIGLGSLDPVSSIAIAAVATAVIAALIGPLLFRLEGPYFAIGSWVAAESLRLVCAQFKSLGGGTGMSLQSSAYSSLPGLKSVQNLFGVRPAIARDIVLYWIALAIVVVVMLAIYRFVKSRHGLALAASRDNDRAARSVGVRTDRIRFALWVAVAGMTGAIGALAYLQKARISPDAAFSVTDWTAYVLFVVVIGGVRTIEGPVVGVMILWGLIFYLSQYGSLYLLVLGVIAILVMLFMPMGIWGAASHRWNVQLFPTQRRLFRDASL